MSVTPAAIVARLRRPLADFALDVSLELPAAGVTALFGPSGAGKTTLLRVIAGLDRRARGSLVVGGATWLDTDAGVFLPPHRRPVGYVFQDADLFPHLDVRANLLYGARRVHRTPDRDRLGAVVAMLGLGDLLARRPATLSGGERRRAAIARALLVEPALLLLDEPLTGLEAARRDEILPWLERLHREAAIPILYVSHAVAEVARLADHLVVIERGRVASAGPLAGTLAALGAGLPVGEDAGVVLEAVVGGLDGAWHLCRADFAGGSVWLPDHGRLPGGPLRLRIRADDVGLAAVAAAHASVQNQLPAVVESIGDGGHPALALVRIRVGATPLLARVTRRSVGALGLAPGTTVVAQVKAAAILGGEGAGGPP